MKISRSNNIKILLFNIKPNFFNRHNKALKMLNKGYKANKQVINSKIHRSIKKVS